MNVSRVRVFVGLFLSLAIFNSGCSSDFAAKDALSPFELEGAALNKPIRSRTPIDPEVSGSEVVVASSSGSSTSSTNICSFTDWLAGKNYPAESVVRYLPNGQFYIAKYENPGYDPTISTWYWAPHSCSAPSVTADPVISSSGSFISEIQFNQMFPDRSSFYTYAQLVEALRSYPAMFNTGNETIQKQEVAAFLANVNHETGGLRYIREINTANYNLYCDSRWVPCIAGQQYYGRGPIQLSWNYNYQAAGLALGLNLLNDPDLVARDAKVAWQTALWFWMTQKGAGTMTSHSAMVNAKGFGETIRTINGSLECGQPQGSTGYNQMRMRVDYYNNFTKILGVAAGSNLGC